jgi:putative tryptophan/tyrosine transport system substrate-binding protein
LAGIGQALIAAKAATATIPIVFTTVSEPVSRGFVQSLSHPGGNITGFTNVEPTVGSKWLQLLKEIAPSVRRVAAIFNPESSAAVLFYRSIDANAEKFGVEVAMLPVHDRTQIASSIETFAQKPGGGLINLPDGFSPIHRELFIELTARFGLPAIYPNRNFTEDGGLISYSVDFAEQYRQAAGYVDRILRGEKPADLPVQQPTKFELVINTTAAKTLGLTVPLTLLVYADELIQ